MVFQMNRNKKMSVHHDCSNIESFSERYSRLNDENQPSNSRRRSDEQNTEINSTNLSSTTSSRCTVNINRDVLFTDDIFQLERGVNLRGVINPAFEHFTACDSPHLSQSSLISSCEHSNDKNNFISFNLKHHRNDFSSSSDMSSSNMSVLQKVRRAKVFSHIKDFFTPDFENDDFQSENNRCGCCSNPFLRFFIGLFPILSWLPNYNFRDDIVSDLFTGCTIVALHIPQGLAYSQLGGLPPVNGLYVSLFPVVIYAILGGSRQLSVGTFAVISITCKEILTSLQKDIIITDFGDKISPTLGSNVETYTVIQVSTSLSLLVGVILLVMGILRLGVLATLFSEPTISAFIVASSLYVFTSQIFDLVGIKLDKVTKVIPFELLDNWYQFFAHIDHANLYTIGLSFLTIVSLLTCKNYIEPYIQQILNLKCFALPAELLAIIVVTLLSWICKFNENYKIIVIPKLDAGFGHMPVSPTISLWKNSTLLTGAFVIAFIVYATSFTLAKLFADNHGYRVNANQELLALGSSNIVGSFFLCFPASGSLARSAVQDKVGGKTQLASLLSASFLVLFLLFLSGYLETLPKSTLASIIVVALMNTLKKFKDVKRFWNISKIDGFLWMVTFVLVVLFGVGNGLLFALAFNLAVLIVRMAIPKFSVRRPILDSECYYSYSGEFQEADIHNGSVVFEFHGSLMHLSAEHFKRQFRLKILSPLRKQQNCGIKYVIFDAHAVSFIDGKGVETLRETRDSLKQIGDIELLIAGCNRSVHETMIKCGFFQKNGHNSSKLFFATTIDAVNWAKMHQSINV